MKVRTLTALAIGGLFLAAGCADVPTQDAPGIDPGDLEASFSEHGQGAVFNPESFPDWRFYHDRRSTADGEWWHCNLVAEDPEGHRQGFSMDNPSGDWLALRARDLGLERVEIWRQVRKDGRWVRDEDADYVSEAVTGGWTVNAWFAETGSNTFRLEHGRSYWSGTFEDDGREFEATCEIHKPRFQSSRVHVIEVNEVESNGAATSQDQPHEGAGGGQGQGGGPGGPGSR